MFVSRMSLCFGLAAALAVAGCLSPTDPELAGPDHMDTGHGHHHTDSSGTAAFTGNEDVVIEVAAGSPDEFRFEPANLTVAPGSSVGIVFTNAGDAEHEFAITALGFHLHAAPGETVRGSFVAPMDPGPFVIGCYLPGHFEAGMRGVLDVRDS